MNTKVLLRAHRLPTQVMAVLQWWLNCLSQVSLVSVCAVSEVDVFLRKSETTFRQLLFLGVLAILSGALFWGIFRQSRLSPNTASWLGYRRPEPLASHETSIGQVDPGNFVATGDWQSGASPGQWRSKRSVEEILWGSILSSSLHSQRGRYQLHESYDRIIALLPKDEECSHFRRELIELLRKYANHEPISQGVAEGLLETPQIHCAIMAIACALLESGQDDGMAKNLILENWRGLFTNQTGGGEYYLVKTLRYLSETEISSIPAESFEALWVGNDPSRYEFHEQVYEDLASLKSEYMASLLSARFSTPGPESHQRRMESVVARIQYNGMTNPEKRREILRQAIGSLMSRRWDIHRDGSLPWLLQELTANRHAELREPLQLLYSSHRKDIPGMWLLGERIESTIASLK